MEATGSIVGYELETDVLGVRAWADAAIPFDNLGPGALEFRREPCEALSQLRPMPERRETADLQEPRARRG